jgi:hypothetical protein
MIVARQAVPGKRCREPRPRRDKRIQPRVSTLGTGPLDDHAALCACLKENKPQRDGRSHCQSRRGYRTQPRVSTRFQPWESSTKTDAP